MVRSSREQITLAILEHEGLSVAGIWPVPAARRPTRRARDGRVTPAPPLQPQPAPISLENSLTAGRQPPVRQGSCAVRYIRQCAWLASVRRHRRQAPGPGTGSGAPLRRNDPRGGCRMGRRLQRWAVRRPVTLGPGARGAPDLGKIYAQAGITCAPPPRACAARGLAPLTDGGRPVLVGTGSLPASPAGTLSSDGSVGRGRRQAETPAVAANWPGFGFAWGEPTCRGQGREHRR
jgi:hypothetical protein